MTDDSSLLMGTGFCILIFLALCVAARVFKDRESHHDLFKEALDRGYIILDRNPAPGCDNWRWKD